MTFEQIIRRDGSPQSYLGLHHVRIWLKAAGKMSLYRVIGATSSEGFSGALKWSFATLVAEG